MKNTILATIICSIAFFSSTVFAYDGDHEVRYSKTKTVYGEVVIRAELIDDDGFVVATGHSGGEGTRKQKKQEAKDVAEDDYDNK